MTTINTSSDIGTELIVLPSDQFKAHTFVAGSGHYPTPRILAALDAVPKAVLAEKVQTFYSGNAEADRLRGELSKAEAELAQIKRYGWTANPPSTWKDRAEAAEAKLARMRALLSFGEVTNYELRAALADAPAFVLPTTAGARFEATACRVMHPKTWEFETFANAHGEAVYVRRDGEHVAYHTPETVMSDFTDHRLIED